MSVKIPDTVINCGNFINGEWVRGEAGTLDVISPYNGKKIGEVSIPSAAQIKTAIEAAETAQKAWGATPMKERFTSKLLRAERILLKAELVS
jgi:acyl-CoA reductase-like NAD-dependent aldehyde dehydrogenase